MFEMARKTAMKHVPLEDRPEFLALVAELANVLPEQFPAIAQQCVDKYADAVLAGHVEVLDQMERAYKALVYKLNGETMFGCGADAGSAANVLARAVAAEPGQVPTWGRCGEFLLEVEGMRIRVQFKSNMLSNHHSCDLHAVDLDRPFLSTTGYRSAGVAATSCLGESVEQAVRRMVLDLLQNEGKPKPIVVDQFSKAAAEKRPQWLVDALAGVRTNGQLAMFGDAPKDPAAKVPLSNAERQKAFRERKRAEKEAAKGAGLISLSLAREDLSYLWWAVDVFQTARRDLEHLKQPYVQERLAKVFGGCPWWTPDALEKLGQDQGILNGEKRVEAERKRGWKNYDDQCKYTDKLAAELAEARGEIQRLQSGLKEIAAEMGGVAPAPLAQGADVAELRRRIASLEQQNAMEIADRAKAFDAVAVLTARLKAAGLPTDYRRQPGE
jgi:hypothetical protein